MQPLCTQWAAAKATQGETDVLDLVARGVEEGRRREQEAFALLLVRKIKQHLDPASGSAAALLTPPDARALGLGADAPNDPWLPRRSRSAYTQKG
jgi:hypothetical protein